MALNKNLIYYRNVDYSLVFPKSQGDTVAVQAQADDLPLNGGLTIATYGSSTTQATVPCRSAEGISILSQNQFQSWSRLKSMFAKKAPFPLVPSESSL